MADKKSPAEGWPVINGDYVTGDPESPVAVATLASHIEQIPVDAGAAIAGPCKTENLGIEKDVYKRQTLRLKQSYKVLKGL